MFEPKPDLIYTNTDNQNDDDNSPVSPLSPITPPYRSDSTSPVPPLRLQASTSAVTKSKRNFDSEKTVIEDPAHTPTYDLSYYFHVQSSSDDIQNNIYRERSSSIGSSVSSTHIVPVIPSHRHKAEQYKQKAEKSHQKAHQFFGEQVQLEISAREIKKEGLKALLYSKVPLGYFLYHLLQEYSSENLVSLFFY
jgi:hypothetical protein